MVNEKDPERQFMPDIKERIEEFNFILGDMVNEKDPEKYFQPDTQERIEEFNTLVVEMYKEKWTRKAFQWVAYELENHDGEGLLVINLLKKWAELVSEDMNHRDTPGRPAEELQAQKQLVDQFLGL